MFLGLKEKGICLSPGETMFRAIKWVWSRGWKSVPHGSHWEREILEHESPCTPAVCASGGGVGVRTQASKLIPRVLATSTTAHPTPEQERLKSKSICEVQHSLIHPHTTVWQAFHILYQYTKVLTSALILVIRFLCPNWSTVSARWGQNRRREEARI